MHTIDLQGEWTLIRTQTGDSYPAAVPGDNLSALIGAEVLPDLYYSQNELSAQWVGREDWRFERSFDLPPELLTEQLRSGIFLHFDSLDTVAEVSVNGTEVGRSDNMFVRRRFAIGHAVKGGANTVSVLIRSPEKAAIERNAGQPYPVPYSEYPIQSPHRNLLRKVQCHAGWDWGPCLMVSGIYGAAYVGLPATHRIEQLHTRQRRVDRERWSVQVTAELEADREAEVTIRATLSGGEGQSVRGERTLTLQAGLNSVELELELSNPELWWPAGYGEQPLYTLTVESDEVSATKRLGFRELETVVEDDERGRSMLFRVNGRDLFCKGANWIPADALPSRQTEEVYRALLTDARDANMNMLRVWGGGQYEPDLFYDLCDELGILIWHDFMFSCSTYPADPAFLRGVEEEVRDQVKRLKDHPSIAIWCGNNENLGALTWFPETRQFRDRYVVDYDRLYERTIGDTTEAIDPDRTFWPSSPSGGRGDYSDNWHDDTKGDMHYWSVWHEGKPFDGYYEVTPRFCSEFGFQSFPSLSAVEGYCPPGERNLTSPVMEHHQRNQRGNTIIIESMSRYFRFPEGLGNMLYLSQVQQAYAIRTAVEYWRSQRPVCMGALYWQLNDNWPVASWASIEYSGKWKLLHYAARRFFAPLHVLGYVKDEAFHVALCNDTAEARIGECTISFVDFDGKTVSEERIAVEVAADSSREVKAYRMAELPAEPQRVFARMSFRDDRGEAVNDAFLTYPKTCEVRKAVVTSKVEATDSGFAVTLTSDKPAFYASLDPGSIEGRFDDNCVTLLPGQATTLHFRTGRLAGAQGEPPRVDLDQFVGQLTLRHLSDSYT